jgi:hypothetical protein
MGAQVLIVVLVVVVVLIGVGSLVAWLRRVRGAGRTVGAPAGQAAEVFPGDVMSRHVVMSGSLARLEIFDWGVRIRGIAVSRWAVPTWEARYSELAIAELVSLQWSRTAVWFRLRDGAGIGLLTSWSREIMAELERREVPVNRSVTKVRRTEDLYRVP